MHKIEQQTINKKQTRRVPKFDDKHHQKAPNKRRSRRPSAGTCKQHRRSGGPLIRQQQSQKFLTFLTRPRAS